MNPGRIGQSLKIAFILVAVISMFGVLHGQPPLAEKSATGNLILKVESIAQSTIEPASPSTEAADSKPVALSDLALLWDDRRNRTKPTSDPRPPRVHKMAVVNEGLRPRVSAMRAGDTLEITAEGKKQHIIAASWLSNPARGYADKLKPPLVFRRTVEQAEPAPIPIECMIHPSEQAFLIVKDHDCVGISDPRGQLKIEDVPVGTHWFRLWHPDLRWPELEFELDGEPQESDRGRIQLRIDPGNNTFHLEIRHIGKGPESKTLPLAKPESK